MAYTPDYTESDLNSGIIDVIVKVILVVGTFITVIVLLMLYSWVKKKMR